MKFEIFVVEFLLPLFFVGGFTHQIFWPIMNNRKVFPLFRSKSSTDILLERAQKQREQAERELKATQELEAARQLERRSQELLFKE